MKLALSILLVVATATTTANCKPIIHPSLLSSFKTQGTVDIMIVMTSETSQVLEVIRGQSFANDNQKATTLYSELNRFTSESQKEVLAILLTQKSDGVKGFYITNKISVKGATPELVESLSGRSDIAEIREAKVVHLENTISNAEPKAIEWGIENINAPQVWESGVTGKGVVVSSIGTGVRFTHEALASGYRSAYGWFDAYDGSLTPIDTQGHGTHTMGTIVGRNGTGVAPSAQWIACLGCKAISCDEAALIGCGQFIFCPTLANGTAPDCTQRPRISSNGWGGGFYEDIVNAWDDVGIISIFPIGSSGPSCQSTSPPGNQMNVIGVGATGLDDTLVSSSSRGPTANFRIKPDISAPGVTIRSAGLASDTAYVTLSGTAMATSHVAGSVALLLEKNPTLTREQVLSALGESAVRPDLYSLDCPSDGVDPNDPWPNNSYGYGKIDVEAAAAIV